MYLFKPFFKINILIIIGLIVSFTYGMNLTGNMNGFLSDANGNRYLIPSNSYYYLISHDLKTFERYCANNGCVHRIFDTEKNAFLEYPGNFINIEDFRSNPNYIWVDTPYSDPNKISQIIEYQGKYIVLQDFLDQFGLVNDEINLYRVLASQEDNDRYFIIKLKTNQYIIQKIDPLRWKKYLQYSLEIKNLALQILQNEAYQSIFKISNNKLEKIFKIYSRVVHNINIDEDTYQRFINNQEPGDGHFGIDTYINRKGVCSGYSRLFLLLLKYVGINASEVGGKAYDNENNILLAHAWVQIGDLYLDPTFELEGNITGDQRKNYPLTWGLNTTYFLVPKLFILYDHSFDPNISEDKFYTQQKKLKKYLLQNKNLVIKYLSTKGFSNIYQVIYPELNTTDQKKLDINFLNNSDFQTKIYKLNSQTENYENINQQPLEIQGGYTFYRFTDMYNAFKYCNMTNCKYVLSEEKSTPEYKVIN